MLEIKVISSLSHYILSPSGREECRKMLLTTVLRSHSPYSEGGVQLDADNKGSPVSLSLRSLFQ